MFTKVITINLLLLILIGCANNNKPFVNSGCNSSKELPQNIVNDPSKISSKTVDLRELPCYWFSMKPSDTLYKETVISQNFAKESFIYSIASYDSYSKPMKQSENIPFPSSEKWIPLLSEDIPNTGFYAKSWVRVKEDDKQELVVAYRGTTDDIADWTRGNLFFTNLFFIDNQFDNSLEFAHKSIKKANEKYKINSIVFTGHSLGGGLAQYTQRYFSNSRAVVFDPSPNKGRLYSLFDWDKKPEDSLRIYEKSEVLEKPRQLLDMDLGYDDKPLGKGKKTRWMSFYTGGIVGQHSMQDLSISLIKVAASINDKDALDIIEQLEKRRTKQELSMPYYSLSNTYNIHRKQLRHRLLTN